MSTPHAPVSSSRPLRVAVASGKGGTGKTLVATGLAALAASDRNRVALIDCDAEAPNDHLFISVNAPVSNPVYVPVAEVDPALCTGCGTCGQLCAFGGPRILGRKAVIFEEMCHGCGLCARACPESAILEVPHRVGEIVVGQAQAFRALTLVSGRLDVGQVKTTPIIREARVLGEQCGAELSIVDSPPGVACSAVESVREADVMLLVTEPTTFGLHDLALALRLGAALEMPMGIVLNRDAGQGAAVQQLGETWNVPILARIPFHRDIAEVYAEGGNAALCVDAVAQALTAVLAALPRLAGEPRPEAAKARS